MSPKKVSKAKKRIAKSDKQVPKIRVVRFNEKSPAGAVGSQAECCRRDKCPCACEGDPTPCLCEPVQCGCLFNHITPPCSCVSYVPPPPCSCHHDVPDPACPCKYHPPSCRTVIPQEGKGKTRTFFKISRTEKD